MSTETMTVKIEDLKVGDVLPGGGIIQERSLGFCRVAPPRQGRQVNIGPLFTDNDIAAIVGPTITVTREIEERNAHQSRNEARYRGNGRHWATPPEVFDPLNAEFAFTLDPCARPESAKVATYFTEEQDGLVQDWGRETVFMNPPYGRELSAWTRKAKESAARGATVVGLLPCSCDQPWFHEDIVAAGAEIRFVRGRIRFLVHDDGVTKWASPWVPNIIVVWRPTESISLDAVGNALAAVLGGVK